MEKFKNPFDTGSIMRLWKRMSRNEIFHNSILEFFKLVDLCQTIILGRWKMREFLVHWVFLKSKITN